MMTSFTILIAVLSIACVLLINSVRKLHKECGLLKEDKHVLEHKIGEQENILSNVREDRENWRDKYKKEHEVAEEFRAYKRLTIDVGSMQDFRNRLEETIDQANKKMRGQITKIDITYSRSLGGQHGFYTQVVMEG